MSGTYRFFTAKPGRKCGSWPAFHLVCISSPAVPETIAQEQSALILFWVRLKEFGAVLAVRALEGESGLSPTSGEGKEAALDIRDLRSLVECIRLVRRTAVWTG